MRLNTLLVAVLIFNTLFACMNKSMPKHSNKINIGYGNSIIDLGQTLMANLGAGESIMYFDSLSILIEKNGAPFKLVTDPEFDPERLVSKINKSLYEVKFVYLQTFSRKEGRLKTVEGATKGLREFKHLQLLSFDGVVVSDLQDFEKFGIRFLIVEEVSWHNKMKFIQSLSVLQDLQILIHDFSFDSNEISLINSVVPNVAVFDSIEFEKRVIAGEIRLD
jgi:hypothetical protein